MARSIGDYAVKSVGMMAIPHALSHPLTSCLTLTYPLIPSQYFRCYSRAGNNCI